MRNHRGALFSWREAVSEVRPTLRAVLPMGVSVLTFKRLVVPEVDNHQGTWALEWQETQRAGH